MDNPVSISAYLTQKYDTPSPRYTSYPTVPYWDENTFGLEAWKEEVKKAFNATNSQSGISLYIHLPFCEKLCTYCACNKRITINHNVEDPYIQVLLKEWDMYLNLFKEKPVISELHLGGGTPTFFSAENLKRLIKGILSKAVVPRNPEYSLEVHPNFTNREQLQVLYDLGFRRMSAGIQDFDPEVQYMINRIQTYEQTENIFNIAREIGYESINADIIYGLPGQTLDTVSNTVRLVKQLRPDRIAFYSYAHVPWKSKAQRRYSEKDLPDAELKRSLYESGKRLLKENGYIDLGMDHFSLPSDSLYQAWKQNELHRNFMGYTTQYTKLLIGLGASAIGDTWTSFAQNIKEVEAYEEAVNAGHFPLVKGHLLNEEDLIIRKHILNIMCHGNTHWEKAEYETLKDGIEKLKDFVNDNLVILHNNSLEVTPLGNAFLRNICMCFDKRYWRKQPESALFSKSI